MKNKAESCFQGPAFFLLSLPFWRVSMCSEVFRGIPFNLEMCRRLQALLPDETFLQKNFGNLNCIGGSALSDVVGHAPEIET